MTEKMEKREIKLPEGLTKAIDAYIESKLDELSGKKIPSMEVEEISEEEAETIKMLKSLGFSDEDAQNVYNMSVKDSFDFGGE